jgi:aryl-alcohol dehydrogenase-like predicted oxidoreductase
VCYHGASEKSLRPLFGGSLPCRFNTSASARGALVSNLCLGTMNFGWVTDEAESFRIMDRALELGINFFDTADVYGWTVQHGTTEEIIGRWLPRAAAAATP